MAFRALALLAHPWPLALPCAQLPQVRVSHHMRMDVEAVQMARMVLEVARMAREVLDMGWGRDRGSAGQLSTVSRPLTTSTFTSTLTQLTTASNRYGLSDGTALLQLADETGLRRKQLFAHVCTITVRSASDDRHRVARRHTWPVGAPDPTPRRQTRATRRGRGRLAPRVRRRVCGHTVLSVQCMPRREAVT